MIVNRLMQSCVDVLGVSGKELARRCEVSHSQIHAARTKNVGPGNAERIAGYFRKALGLSDEQYLRLKAEIMGHPGNLMRAYLGDAEKTAREFRVSRYIAEQILDLERRINRDAGLEILERLVGESAPAPVVRSVQDRVDPPPKRPRSARVPTEASRELQAKRKAAVEGLSDGKPLVYRTLERSGISRQDLPRAAGVARGTVSRALYGSVGPYASHRITWILSSAVGLSSQEADALRRELEEPPKTNS